MTFEPVFHDRFPLRLVPRNFAPSVGPVAPPRHSAPSVSGDHSPMRVTSATIAHSWSAEAETSRETLISSVMPRTLTADPGPCFVVECTLMSAEAPAIDPHVYARRWWTLAVLCLSLLIVFVGNS